ncbi:MAG: hypothetical protein ACQEW9_01205 [Bacteroidota bacterium]
MKKSLKQHYLGAIFFLGLFLLNYPVLAIYDIPERWLGIPVMYLFVFGFWSLLITITYLVIRKPDKNKSV